MGGHGPGDFQFALFAVRQAGCHRMGVLIEADELQEIHGPLPRFLFFPLLAFRVEHAGPDAGMKLGVAADEAVFQDRHLGKEADVLKRPGNAQRCDFMRFLPFDGFTLKEDISFRYLIHAGNQIEQGRLAGTIRADNAVNLSVFHGKRNIGRSRDPAKAFDDML